MVKQRDMEKGAVFGFRLQAVTLGQNQHGEAVTTCTVSQTEAQTCKPREAKLADRPATLLRTFRNMDPERTAQVRPQPDMPMVSAIRRDDLRLALIQDGWFPENAVSDGVIGEGEVKPRTGSEGLSRPKLVKPGFTIENNALTPLKRLGIINFNREWIWLTSGKV